MGDESRKTTMKIIAIDLAGVCRRFFELDKTGSLTDGSALAASVQYITRAADGFDRVVIARDVRPSFRRSICPTYKAGREDPGPVYQKLEIDVMSRLYADGATVFPNNTEAKAPYFAIGDGHPEADDVIASLVHWCTQSAPSEVGPLEVTIASEDSDLCALVSDEFGVSMRRFDGSIWREADVLEKLGYGPDLVREVKALAGDAADNYKPFPHHEPPSEGGRTKPGIGPKSALELLSKWGRYGSVELGLSMTERVLLAAQDGAANDRDRDGLTVGDSRIGMGDCHERRCLLAGGAQALKMGYGCATLLSDLPLGFDRILAKPVQRPIAGPKKTAEEPSKASTTVETDTPDRPSQAAPMVVHNSQAIDRPRRDKNQIERYALQPRRYEGQGGVWDVATELHNARVFPQFSCWQGVAAAIIVAAEQGIGIGQALRGTYVVKGKLSYSAALIVSLVKREKSCKLFRLAPSSDDKKATVRFWHADDPEPATYTFTWEMAVRMGVTTAKNSSEKTKWETQPHLMLAWAAMRECARLHWPEVVAGMYTPDELRRSKDLDDVEFEQTEADMDGEIVQ